MPVLPAKPKRTGIEIPCRRTTPAGSVYAKTKAVSHLVVFPGNGLVIDPTNNATPRSRLLSFQINSARIGVREELDNALTHQQSYSVARVSISMAQHTRERKGCVAECVRVKGEAMP